MRHRSRCLGAAGGSRAPADSSESPAARPGRREAGGWRAGGGSGSGRRPARSSEALRAGKPQGGVCGRGSAGLGAAEGSGDHWQAAGVTCGVSRRWATAGRNKAPQPPALDGPPPGPPPLPRSRRGHPAARDPGWGWAPGAGGPAAPALTPDGPPKWRGPTPPTLFKTSWGAGVSVGRDRTSMQASTPSSPAPPPRELLRCWGHHVLGQGLASAHSCRCRLTTSPPWHSGNRAAGPRN